MIKRVKDFMPEVHDYYYIEDDGTLYSYRKGVKKMSNNAMQRGYIVNSLFGQNFRKDCKRHWLVAKAFLPAPLEGQNQINHIDGNKTNNSVENLEWCSPKENIHHAWKNRLARPHAGNECPSHILTEKEVIEICELLVKGELEGQEIAKMYGVHKGTISAIRCKKNWKHITEKYNFK